MANLRLIITALNKASGEINKVKNEIEGVGKSGKTAEGGVKGFGSSLSSVIGTAALVAGSMAAVGLAIREVYEDLKEGAELEYTRTKFDNLAESIGIVSDALLVDLREATRGTVSDAELVAGAANFMALGLADTHEEVVRLTTVAGALGMNMNQLVLTLTNQTTMRFDQLGVAVEGFDEKVKALEDSGLSAQEAFTEAFLQQAEEQIQRVGNISETSAGKIMQMESAFKNLGDAIKLSMADTMDVFAPAMATLANNITNNVKIGDEFTNVINGLRNAQKSGLIDADEYNAIMREIGVHTGMGTVTAEQLAIAQDALNEILGDSSVAADQTAESMIAQSIAAKQAEEANKKAATAQEELTEAQKKMIAEHEKISTLDNNYKGIIDLAYKYTDILEEITVQEQIMAEEPIGSEKYEEAKAKVDELKGSMDELANRVTLDMLQATIAIGGVTEAELSAYMDMAIEMGLMSQGGADAAISAYSTAIETINKLEIDDKTGNVIIDTVAAYAAFDALERYQLLDKEMRVFVKYYSQMPSNWYSRNYEEAVGGAVQGGEPYTWQEYGYRGELFVPSADGFIMSRADAERALSKALAGGASKESINADDIGRAIADALVRAGVNKNGNVYNLTMPTSSNPADVKTAFELMEAWA